MDERSLSWDSPKWKVECGGWVKLYDGFSWILVEEIVMGDLVWVNRNLVTESEYD
jgi:hypothetical protein